MPNDALQKILEEKQVKAAETKLDTALTMLERNIQGLGNNNLVDPKNLDVAENLLQNLREQKRTYPITAPGFREHCKALLHTANESLQNEKTWAGVYSFVNHVIEHITPANTASKAYQQSTSEPLPHTHFYKGRLNAKQMRENSDAGLDANDGNNTPRHK